MPLRFTGTFEELKELLAGFSQNGTWHDLNDNQKQFRHNYGGILNWYLSTGTFAFQGKVAGKALLEAEATKALQPSGSTTKPPPRPEAGQYERGPASAEPVGPQTTPAAAKGPETTSRPGQDILGRRFSDSELLIGLVSAVGTETDLVVDILEERLKAFGYEIERVRISSDVISELVNVPERPSTEYARIDTLMDAGNEARQRTGDCSVLALGVAAKIAYRRQNDERGNLTIRPRRAYIITSLKHPAEVDRLREIYPQGFYLLGVHADVKRRHELLVKNRLMTREQADLLMRRDEDENLDHGQRTSDTFHLSDFFVRIDGNQDRLRNDLWRILDILFGRPYVTPTFDEYAMFMAFAASLRSADLSRQVGAVVARNDEIIAAGANDCPKYGGKLYWPVREKETEEIKDVDGGRDYTRGEDANKAEQIKVTVHGSNGPVF
jgi:deoxycytidylate deaminase